MKIVTYIFLILSFFTLLPSSSLLSSAFAHVLESDGTIGAVIHISPDDDPIAGKESGFFFEFKDKENKFTPENCRCTFTILQAGKEIYSQPLFQGNTNPSLDNASVLYTFPEKNIYTVRVTGEPTTQNAFEPFTLSYDIRVSREEADKEAAEASPFLTFLSTYPVLILGVLFSLAALSYALYTRKTKQQ